MNRDQLEKALEARRRFEDAGGSAALDKLRTIENTGIDIADIQKRSRLLTESRIEPFNKQINTENLTAIIQFLRQPLPAELVQTLQNFQVAINAFGSRVVEIRDAVNNALKASEPVLDFLRQLGEANKKFESLRIQINTDSPFNALISNSINAYESNSIAVVRRIEKQDLRNHSALAARLVQPSLSYADFSQRTIERLVKTEGDNERAALGGSLIVAQEELFQTTSLIEEVTAAPIQIVDELYSNETSNYNIYDSVQLDLINVDSLPTEATYPVLRRFSTAIAVASLIRQMMRTLLRCNKTALMKGGSEIFKQTTQATEAMVVLQGIIVRDENDLRDFITLVYMVFYEGAGDQKLRFLKENGGGLERTECEAVWNLKAIRNKWLAHDPEHGKPGDIRASYRSLGEALENLGFARFPRNSQEFESLQFKLTRDLLKFLELVEDRL